MDPTLIIPFISIMLSVVTFVVTDRRANRVESRAAAKETVELLVTQNKVLHDSIEDLLGRVRNLEEELKLCQAERAELLRARQQQPPRVG